MPNLPITLLRLSRPRFWPYTAGPFALGVVAAAASRGDVVSVRSAAWLLFFVFPANLLIYGVNDVFDYESDCRNAKKTGYEAALPPDRRALVAGWTCALCLPFAPLLTGAPWAAIAALGGFLFFSLEYSAPPIRAKTKPFLDAAFNILYVFPGIFAYLLHNGQRLHPAVIVAATLWCMSMHAFSAIPDIEADRLAEMPTIATTLGKTGTLTFCGVCYALASVLGAPYLGILSPILGCLYLLMVWASRKDTFAVYRRFPLLNTAAGMAIFFTLLLRLP